MSFGPNVETALPSQTRAMTAGRRLAYLTLEAPRPGQATYTHVYEIIDELGRAGWSVELFSAARGGASTQVSWVDRLIDYVSVQCRLALRLRRFDVLYIRGHFMAAPIAILAYCFGIPVVHEINGRPDDLAVTYRRLAPFLPILKCLYWIQMRLAAHMFAVTDGLFAWAGSFSGNTRASVVSNGANTRLFRPEGPKAELGYDYAVFVGGLVAWHGVATMIEATRQPHWPAGVRLLVIGDGPQRGLLTDCDPDKVVWLGRVAYEAVPAYLRGALVSLCMIEDPGGRSSTGVAPLKLFEAMACGAPVLVSDLPFQSELVRSISAGRVIPMGDAPRLSAAVATIREHRDIARDQGLNGAAYVQSMASWQIRARQISDVLVRICDRNRQARGLPL